MSLIAMALIHGAFALPSITPWLLPNEDKRQALTQLYIAQHCGVPCEQANGLYPATMIPKAIVVHWTASSTAQSAWNTFAQATLSGRTDLTSGGSLNVSAHYLVDRDGTIYELLPPTRIARHCIGLNHIAIGIENVGDGTKYPITAEQVKANVNLIKALANKYPITHLIGHHEHNAMETHPYFQELNPKYRTTKIDPGNEIMTQIRAGLTELNLEGPPQDSEAPR